MLEWIRAKIFLCPGLLYVLDVGRSKFDIGHWIWKFNIRNLTWEIESKLRVNVRRPISNVEGWMSNAQCPMSSYWL